ncbi:MAG: PRC-barrel domain-containing protein [Ignavibacteria bacterium]
MEKINLEKQGLYRLGELKNYEVVKSDPDVRGWDVYSKDQKIIGKVDELIVDPEMLKVRYLDLYLNEDIKRDIDSNRHLLIPIGSAELNDKKKAVFIETIETVTLLKIPGYEAGQSISREYENKVRRTIHPDEELPEREDDFYNSHLFNENRFYKSRPSRLYELKDLESSKVLGNNPDIRGWDVFTLDGIMIGKIDELLVDKESSRIRYVIVKIDKEYRYNAGNRVLIPIGLASLGINSDKVLIDVDSNSFKSYPIFKGEIISREYEENLLNSISGIQHENRHINDDEFYNRGHFNDDRFLSRRKS